MKCPYCDGVVDMMPYVEYNVECYGKSAIGRTSCCGRGLKVKRVTRIVVEPLHSDDKSDVDDWGQPLENNL